MELRVLGHTGVKVSPLCLGAMMFGAWGNTDHDDSVRIIKRALDAGINFIDTADVYSAGESEEIVAKALAGTRREDIVLATKAHGAMGRDPNERGNSRRWLIRECENSLRRLGTDYIDLYQIHRPDPDTDIDETLGALSDLIRAGKICYAGSSTFPPSQIVEAQWTAERRGRERFVCEQPPYSILVRGVETEVLPVCQRYGMGVIPWSPLAGGWLSGRYRKGQDLPVSRRAERIPQRYDMSLPGNQAKLDAVEQLAVLAEESGLTLIQLAIAFVLSHPAVSAAIIGPRTMEQLESQLAAGDVDAQPGHPGPDRRDRAARHQPQLPGRRLRAPVPHRPVPPPQVAARREAEGLHAGGDDGMGAGAPPVGEAGAPEDRERDQAHPRGWLLGPELRDQRDALPGGDQREHGDEVVRLMADPGHEAGALADPHGDGVAERARAADDPVAVPGSRQRPACGPGLPAFRHGEEHGLVEQRDRIQGGIGPGGRDVVIVQQGHVEALVAQCPGHGHRVQLGDPEVEGRMVAAQRDQGRGQQRADGAGERPDAHGSGQPGARGRERRGGRFQGGQHRLGVLYESRASGRERDAPADVLQQWHARLALQRGELLRHRGRRVGVSLGHRGDGAQVRQVPQQAQAADVKH